MPDKDDEKMKIVQNLKEEFVKLRALEEYEAARAKKVNQKNLKREERVGKYYDKSMGINERGEKDTKANIALRAAEKTLDQETMGFNVDPVSSISTIVHNIKLLINMLNAELYHVSSNEPSTIPGAAVVRDLKERARYLAYDFSRWLSGDPKVSLPTLSHLVTFENNNLKVEPLTGDIAKIKSDSRTGQERVTVMKSAINAHFDELVKRWWQEQDIEEKQGVYYKKASNTALTSDEFTELKNDPKKGLQAFLKETAPGLRFAEEEPAVCRPNP